MYTLIYILGMSFLGTYADMPSCQNAIREIYSQRANPPGKRLPELEESINLQVSIQKQYLCVPNKKN